MEVEVIYFRAFIGSPHCLSVYVPLNGYSYPWCLTHLLLLRECVWDEYGKTRSRPRFMEKHAQQFLYGQASVFVRKNSHSISIYGKSTHTVVFELLQADYEYDAHMHGFLGALQRGLPLCNFLGLSRVCGRSVWPSRKFSLFKGAKKEKLRTSLLVRTVWLVCVLCVKYSKYQNHLPGVQSSVCKCSSPWDTWWAFSLQCRNFKFGMFSEAKMTAMSAMRQGLSV